MESIEEEKDERRKEMGVEEEMREMKGMKKEMMVEVGEEGVKKMEDLEGYEVEDMVGWRERKDGEKIKNSGVMKKLEIQSVDEEKMVMEERLKEGWIKEEEMDED